MLVSLGFLLYFGTFCFEQTWYGDFQLYCAAVSRLYENLAHPGHEALVAPTSQSSAYTPYLVLVGALGHLARVTPYRALQVAGVCNLMVFLIGAAVLFARHSMHRRWEVPFGCFIFATLMLRWNHFGWSSETSLVALQYVQSYPSTLAWGLAFLALGTAKRAGEGRLLALAGLVAVMAVLMVTHAITASWTIGMVALYGLWTGAQARRHWPLTRLLLVLGAAGGLALLWPYSPLLGQSSLASAHEPSLFGRSPLHDFLNLYVVAVPGAVYLTLRLRRHAFWIAGFLVTLGALLLWRRAGIDYGNRYSFFAGFCAQFLVGEAMALGVWAATRRPLNLDPHRRWPRFDRPWALALLGAALVAWLPSPMLRQRPADVRLPLPARGSPTPLERYYARYPSVRPFLSGRDVVMTPSRHAVFDLGAMTGAHFVTSPYAVRVADAEARAADVRVFFDGTASAGARAEIVRRRGVTKILLSRDDLLLAPEIARTYGPALYQDAQLALFSSTRTRSAIVSSPSP